MDVMRHASTFLLPSSSPPTGDVPALTYALVVLNQRLPRFAPLLWSRAQLRVCADGGANRIYDGMPELFPDQDPLDVRLRYKPDVIKGDMDSIRDDVKEFYSNLEVKIVDESHDQDTTDLHKCIAFICSSVPDPEKSNLCILVVGALGGRFDHEVGNINVLYRFSNIQIILLSDDCLIYLLPKTHCHEIHIQSSVEGPHCGLIPAGAPSTSTTTTGLQWDLSTGMKSIFTTGFWQFLREIYDGQLYVKLKKGENFPAMDPWGTSDPYVILQIDGQVTKSKVKWGTKEPIWNEDFTLNIKTTPRKTLQVVAWDANLVTPHKRMGNAAVNLESLCDGNSHEMVVELDGIGGGGKIYLEIKYKSYDEIEEDKQWWRVPFISDILTKSNLESAIKMVFGSESVNVSQFVQLAFGQLKPFNYAYLREPSSSDSDNDGSKFAERSLDAVADSKQVVLRSSSSESSGHNTSLEKGNNLPVSHNDANLSSSSLERKADESAAPAEYFWKAFADVINQTVLQKLGFSIPEIRMWDGFDLLHMVSLQLRKTAEEEYVESGLASPETKDENDRKSDPPPTTSGTPLLDINKVSWDILSQTEAIFRAMMVLTATLWQQKRNSPSGIEEEDRKDASTTVADIKEYSMDKVGDIAEDGLPVDTQKAEEMRELFSGAESAMEAWAMLATSFGRTSFIKSDFEKICFLDNISTDTQVAIWRDSFRRRLVIAFRGTEQAKWKDLRTDLMFVPAGLNPERLGGDFKQEVQVHSGFLHAYDSVRNRIIELIKVVIGSSLEDDLESMPKWHVYVTGHSLGGALATLLALELSSSQMAKHGVISVTMYNFGSPRVGNRRFAELYNEKVKDSWRVVNHRDIIPTVPRLMGYCHVAQPVYLAAGDLEETLVNKIDGYQGDVIGESTPDILVSEFMKGEKQLVEKILQTEINLLSTIRDGTALMQHMEDFYYITLLESVRSNYQRTNSSSEEGCPSTV